MKQLDAYPAVAVPLLARLISGKSETPDEKRRSSMRGSRWSRAIRRRLNRSWTNCFQAKWPMYCRLASCFVLRRPGSRSGSAASCGLTERTLSGGFARRSLWRITSPRPMPCRGAMRT